MDDDGDEGVFLRGWVKWALGNDAMEEFIRNYLRPLGLVSLKCTYEETGCFLYGEFTYEGDQLFDTFLPQDDAFWEDEDNWDNDDYYDNLEPLAK